LILYKFNKRPCASIDAEAGAAAPLSKKKPWQKRKLKKRE
jgi:hypothetical protein